jgi:hypothetical protein
VLPVAEEHVDVEADELSREFVQALVPARAGSILENDIVLLEVAEIPETSLELLLVLVCRVAWRQTPDRSRCGGGSGPGDERRGEEAARQGAEEGTSVHS